jgi:hypothetical protein
VTDSTLVDALWNCFSKFQVSKAKSINLVKDLHTAVLDVKSPTYGPKAVEKLAAPVDPSSVDQVRDQIEFWQKTSMQLLGELKFAPGAKPIVAAMLAPSKAALRAVGTVALLKMPADGEKQLLAALNGTDPELAKLGDAYPDKTHQAVLADAVAYFSRPAGRDAVLKLIDATSVDAVRVAGAQSLYRFPHEKRTQDAFVAAYGRVPPTFHSPLLGGVSGREALLQAAAHFYDPSMTDWVLREVAAAKGEDAEALHSAGLGTAMRLMTADRAKAVTDAVNRFGSALDKQMLPLMTAPLDKCKQDTACYVAILDEMVPSSPRGANARHIKAAYMAAIYGNVDTAKTLVAKLDKVQDAGVRLAVIEAVDHLTPKGDTALAEAIEKVVETDMASGNKSLLAANDALAKVALAMRARAMP